MNGHMQVGREGRKERFKEGSTQALIGNITKLNVWEIEARTIVLIGKRESRKRRSKRVQAKGKVLDVAGTGRINGGTAPTIHLRDASYNSKAREKRTAQRNARSPSLACAAEADNRSLRSVMEEEGVSIGSFWRCSSPSPSRARWTEGTVHMIFLWLRTHSTCRCTTRLLCALIVRQTSSSVP